MQPRISNCKDSKDLHRFLPPVHSVPVSMMSSVNTNGHFLELEDLRDFL